MKKLKYPEYINGVKQVQNPIARFFIKLWYSEWFRCSFIICPVWLFALMVLLMARFPEYSEIFRYSCIGIYMILFTTALIKNDFTNLNRIGLNVYHEPLEVEIDEKNS